MCIVKPKSEVQSPKVKTKRTWADTNITGATTHPPTHPSLLSMKESSGKKVLIVKVAQNDPLTHPAKKIDQVDSEIKDVGYSSMFKKKFINRP